MLLAILWFEENTITFEAVDSFMAIGALGFPDMLLHALDQTSSCTARWSGASQPPTCATLGPKLGWKFFFLILFIFVTMNAQFIVILMSGVLHEVIVDFLFIWRFFFFYRMDIHIFRQLNKLAVNLNELPSGISLRAATTNTVIIVYCLI